MAHAVAIVRDDIRPMTVNEKDALARWRARTTERGPAGSPPDIITLSGDLTADVEHAAAPGAGTLCGLPEPAIARYRHLFDPRRAISCATCADLASA